MMVLMSFPVLAFTSANGYWVVALIAVMTPIVVNLALMLPELLCCHDEGKDQDRSSVALCNVLLGGVKVTMGEKMKIGIIWANDGK
jgi:hypothetical protein